MEKMEPGSDNEPDLSVRTSVAKQFKIQHINHEMKTSVITRHMILFWLSLVVLLRLLASKQAKHSTGYRRLFADHVVIIVFSQCSSGQS